MQWNRWLVLAAVALLAACSTPQYVMGTKSGQLIVSYGEPRLDEKSGLYTYYDADGKKITIPKAEVVQIMER